MSYELVLQEELYKTIVLMIATYRKLKRLLFRRNNEREEDESSVDASRLRRTRSRPRKRI